jgi:hypothetical protein
MFYRDQLSYDIIIIINNSGGGGEMFLMMIRLEMFNRTFLLMRLFLIFYFIFIQLIEVFLNKVLVVF